MFNFFDIEKEKVKLRLAQILEKEAENIKSSINLAPSDAQTIKDELHKVRIALLTRKALVEFEAEEIVKKRMDMRLSVFALAMSCASIIISIVAILRR